MTRSPGPRPPATGRTLAAAGAALLALTLLGSGFGTAARWSAEAPLGTQAVSTGRLAVELGPTTAVHDRSGSGSGSTDVTALAAVPHVTVGDAVTVTTRAVLAVEGTRLTATLRVDPGVPAGSPVLGSARVVPVAAAPALPAAPGAAGTWTVTPEHHGAAYDVEVTYRVPATRSGAARHDADPAGWWGSELQHVTLDLGTPTVTLAQN
ncbi:hypothetical protein ACH9DO_08165 [Kocuria sp. M1N1S27]|uniref:hypothetical protein n=1 Tax=Kocuria kalidii TaxID=3376283 RepID=UPI00379471D9